jgi:hypothetical protein
MTTLNYYRDRSDLQITELPGPAVTITCTAAPVEQSVLLLARRRSIVIGLFMFGGLLIVLCGLATSAGLFTKGRSLETIALWLATILACTAGVAVFGWHSTFGQQVHMLQLARQQATRIEADANYLTIHSTGPFGEIDERLKQRWIVDILYVRDFPEEGEQSHQTAEHWLQVQLIDGRDIWLLPNRSLNEYHRIVTLLRRGLDLSPPVVPADCISIPLE